MILFTSKSSEEEDGKEKRKQSRPTVDPKHVEKFTAEVFAKKAAKQAAKKLETDYLAIIDPQIQPNSGSVAKVYKKAKQFCEAYDMELINAVAAVMTQRLATIAKLVERSGHIQGSIMWDLKDAYVKLTAGINSFLGRKGVQEAITLQRESERRLQEDQEKWEKENEELRREVLLLQAKNVRLRIKAKFSKHENKASFADKAASADTGASCPGMSCSEIDKPSVATVETQVLDVLDVEMKTSMEDFLPVDSTKGKRKKMEAHHPH